VTSVGSDAGVVDQYVDGAVSLDHPGDRGDRCLVVDIQLHVLDVDSCSFGTFA